MFNKSYNHDYSYDKHTCDFNDSRACCVRTARLELEDVDYLRVVPLEVARPRLRAEAALRVPPSLGALVRSRAVG